MQSHCHEKEQVAHELNQAILNLRIEYRAAEEHIQQLQGELSSLQGQMSDLRDVSEGKGERIRELSEQIDNEKKKVRKCYSTKSLN